METALRDFLLDYLDDVEERRWEYEATLKAAEERRENDKQVNTRNLHEAKRKIAFYDHLRDLINGDTSLDERWKHRYQDILSTLLREHNEATRIIKESMFNANDIFDNRPSDIDEDTWRALTGQVTHT